MWPSGRYSTLLLVLAGRDRRATWRRACLSGSTSHLRCRRHLADIVIVTEGCIRDATARDPVSRAPVMVPMTRLAHDRGRRRLDRIPRPFFYQAGASESDLARPRRARPRRLRPRSARAHRQQRDAKFRSGPCSTSANFLVRQACLSTSGGGGRRESASWRASSPPPIASRGGRRHHAVTPTGHAMPLAPTPEAIDTAQLRAGGLVGA